MNAIEMALEAEERAPEITSREMYEARVVSRRALHLKLGDLLTRYKGLSYLPPQQQVQWAETMIGNTASAIMVLDTTSVKGDADIIRICIGDMAGNLLYDRLVKPLRQVNEANSVYTGLTSEAVSEAEPLCAQWEMLTSTLKDRHILAYNYAFLEDRLRENAAYYQLPPPMLSGEDVLSQTTNYFHAQFSMKLPAVCERMGFFVPSVLDAPERVSSIARVLQAMSNGMTSGVRENR